MRSDFFTHGHLLLEPLPKQSRHCLSHRVVTRSSDLQQRHDVVAVVSALLLTVAAAHDALLSFKTSCLPFSVTSTTAKRRGKRLASKQRPRSFSNTRTLPDLTKRQGGWSDRPGADGGKPVDVAPGAGCSPIDFWSPRAYASPFSRLVFRKISATKRTLLCLNVVIPS